MCSREFLQPRRGYTGAGRDKGVIRRARQDFQDIPKRPRRRGHLPVAFQSETQLIVRQRETSIEIDGVPQTLLGLGGLSEVFENQRLIEMDLGIQSVTAQQRSPILGRALPIAPIGEPAQAFQIGRTWNGRKRLSRRFGGWPHPGHRFRRHF